MGVFLSSISHELRTPLNGLLGNLHVLEEEIARPEHLRILRDVRTSAERLFALAERVIELTRLTAADLDPEAEATRFELGQGVEAVVERAQRARPGVTIAVHAFDRRLAVNASQESLSSVLRELLDNAAKHTRDRVDLRYGLVWDCTDEARRPRLHLACADRGPGIPPEDRERVMRAFERVESGLARSSEGLGIGLAIVHARLRAAGGSWCLQAREGGGTVVHVDLPLELSPDPEAEADPEAVPSVERVLVVEDNAVNARMVKRLLERRGLDAVWAENGAACIERCLRERFDLILMDLQMPVMDGLAAARALRAAGCTSKIVALTANATEKDRVACFEAGMDGFVGKPLRPGHLDALLGRPTS